MRASKKVKRAKPTLIGQATPTQDSLTNLIADLMDGRDKMAYNQYAWRKVVGRDELITMYRSNWLGTVYQLSRRRLRDAVRD
ncbi:MAG: hypothetical protein ON057_001455 [Glomeribacter sp. 1016415]|nr:hypothetical protein [Glomeribacter sp. 1016415]